MENEVFASLLRTLLKERGISQKWLANEAETTEATISRYVYGQTQPEIRIVVKIAGALNVSVDYLCGLTNMSSPKESLNSEILTLIKCYERADNGDKDTIWSVLKRYMTQEEKDNPFSYAAADSAKRGA